MIHQSLLDIGIYIYIHIYVCIYSRSLDIHTRIYVLILNDVNHVPSGSRAMSWSVNLYPSPGVRKSWGVKVERVRKLSSPVRRFQISKLRFRFKNSKREDSRFQKFRFNLSLETEGIVITCVLTCISVSIHDLYVYIYISNTHLALRSSDRHARPRQPGRCHPDPRPLPGTGCWKHQAPPQWDPVDEKHQKGTNKRHNQIVPRIKKGQRGKLYI